MTAGELIARIADLTARIATANEVVDELIAERDACYVEARRLAEPPTYREIARAAGVTEQGVHKAFGRMRSKGLIP